jgi:hypothetical protein
LDNGAFELMVLNRLFGLLDMPAEQNSGLR